MNRVGHCRSKHPHNTFKRGAVHRYIREGPSRPMLLKTVSQFTNCQGQFTVCLLNAASEYSNETEAYASAVDSLPRSFGLLTQTCGPRGALWDSLGRLVLQPFKTVGRWDRCFAPSHAAREPHGASGNWPGICALKPGPCRSESKYLQEPFFFTCFLLGS